MQSYKLSERAVLMRVSLGLPGENRQDKPMSETVKSEHALGSQSGKWVKQLFPVDALAPIKKLDNEARAYHAQVTLPFDAGIGILPGALIMEYGDKMRDFASRRSFLVEQHFLNQYDQWVDWARKEHNGTFDPDLYPGVEDARKKFYFRTEPLPVPESGHYTETMAGLLGLDANGVDIRIADAMQEAQRELLRRMIEPVRAMAQKLMEEPKNGREDIVFRDTLVGNIKEIAQLAPKLNIQGDPTIDAFAKEMQYLGDADAEVLRKDKSARAMAAAKAEALSKRLAGYKF